MCAIRQSSKYKILIIINENERKKENTMTKKVAKPIPLKTELYVRPVKALPKYRCRWCDNEWQPRVNLPKTCPYCHRINWLKSQSKKRSK